MKLPRVCGHTMRCRPVHPVARHLFPGYTPHGYSSFREEVMCMDSPAPAERAASQSSDDRLSSWLYLCQQLNAERDLPRLLDLMAREVARLLAAERAFFCGSAPSTNCGPWWRSKASRYALMHVVGLRGPWYKQASRSKFPPCIRTPAFIQPLMPAPDFEHAISLLCHYAII
jgi:hypothetical protein